MPLKQKLYTHIWFIIINAILGALIASRYFAFLPEFPSELIAILFIIMATLGQMFLLSLIIGIISAPLILFTSKMRLFSQALVATIGIALLLIDTLVFAQYRFHLNPILVELVFLGDVVSFPLITWVSVIAGLTILFALQYSLISYLNKNNLKLAALKAKRKFAYFFIITILFTHISHIWVAAHAYQPIIMVKRYLPLFYPATANRFMQKHGWIDEEAIAYQQSLRLTRKSDLSYPLTPLTVTNVEKPTNIMLIVVDSWRADSFNADNTPLLWSYTNEQQAITFNNHLSTGNATRTGIFGLFYGLPGTYWHNFLANTKPPLLMQRMQYLNYQLGIFAAATLANPEFDRTVFAGIKDLRKGSIGNSPSSLDRNLTDDWHKWYEIQDRSKPIFSFLFYDAPHGYDFPEDFKHRYEPMLSNINYLELNNNTDPKPFLNRYKTSVRCIDTLIAEVLNTLEQKNDLTNTLIVITGDHGQEINDNKLNFWGHNSNFTNAQIHVPFIVFAPNRSTSQLTLEQNLLTSHQDLAPTIMKNYLGVSSPIAKYSTGEDLFDLPATRDWVLSSSYSSYAIVTNDNILEVSGGGLYQFMDKNNQVLKDQKPETKNLQPALEQISRFSK